MPYIKSLATILLVALAGCSDPGDVMIDAKRYHVTGNAKRFYEAGGPNNPAGESIINVHTTDHIIRVGDYNWSKNEYGNWHTTGTERYVPKSAKDAQAIAKYMGE